MKNVTTLITLLSVLTLCSLPAFAHNKEERAEHLQVMRQAADELKSSDPALSKKLNEFADKKEDWMKDQRKDWQELKEQKNKDIQKIREAFEYLQGKNDDLAKDLKEIADRWDKKLQEKENKM